jgi:uncharacterized protein
MRVLIDIGHPAHVHLFRNLALEMMKKGSSFIFTVREGENQARLLKESGFEYVVIGKKQKGTVRKLMGIISFSLKIYKVARIFKPDLFISHGSMYAGYAAFLCGKKHIALEDTGNMEQIIFSRPVSDVILSPRALQVDLGKKHLRYDGFHELAYLCPGRFTPDKKVLVELGVREDEPFVILRFISWNASHDLGQSGLDSEQKNMLVNELSKIARIFISGEKDLPQEFARYALPIAPHRLHDALYFASLYIGEGATTASECAMLGTPAIYVNSISAGTLIYQEKSGLVFCYHKFEGVVEKALEILKSPGIKEKFREKNKIMLSGLIDVTAFLLWFVENYPQSRDKMKADSGLQLQFLIKS